MDFSESGKFSKSEKLDVNSVVDVVNEYPKLGFAAIVYFVYNSYSTLMHRDDALEMQFVKFKQEVKEDLRDVRADFKEALKADAETREQMRKEFHEAIAKRDAERKEEMRQNIEVSKF